MMKAITNWRYYVLFIVAGIAIFGIFSIPDYYLPMIEWMESLVISKSIGVASILVNIKLINLWEKKNLIPELSNLIKEE